QRAQVIALQRRLDVLDRDGRVREWVIDIEHIELTDLARPVDRFDCANWRTVGIAGVAIHHLSEHPDSGSKTNVVHHHPFLVCARAVASNNVHATACCQPACCASRSTADSRGSNRSPAGASALSSFSDDHWPMARPASQAAPSAESSAEALRITDNPTMSAWICISRLLR